MLYANYMRNKLHHLTKTKEINGYPIKLTSKYNKKAINYTIYGNGVGDYSSTTGKYLIALVNKGKNQIENTAVTQTVSGVTITKLSDGTLNLNGTATATIKIAISKNIQNNIDVNTAYTLSGAPYKEAGYFTINLYNESGTYLNAISAWGSVGVKTFTLSSYTYATADLYLYITKDSSCDNYIIKPMIEQGSTATEYEQYRNKYSALFFIDSPIEDGDSISYKSDNLPYLQLFKGENNITVESTVKPTSIDVKYYD